MRQGWHTRLRTLLFSLMIVTAVFGPLSASAAVPVVDDEAGDAINGGGGASDIVGLRGHTNATLVNVTFEVADADHPKLIYYEVNFTNEVTGVTYLAFTSYQTDGDLVSSFVIEEDGSNATEIDAAFDGDGKNLTLAIPRDAIGSPAQGDNLTAISAETRHGQTGDLFDEASIGDYRIGNNAAPVLDPLGPFTVTSCDTLSFTVSASDADGDAVSLAIDEDTRPLDATFNETSGAFSWTPLSVDAGEHVVTFTASDGDVTSSLDVEIEVIAFSCEPIVQVFQPSEAVNDTPITSTEVSEGATLTVEVNATDPQAGDAVSLEVSDAAGLGLPDGATFSITETGSNYTVGVISWTPDFDQAGNYTVRLNASDTDGFNGTEFLDIEVLNSNGAPVFDPLSDQSVTEDSTLTFTVSATDPEGDPVTLSADLSNLPGSPSFNASSGEFNWTPDNSSAGLYNVTFFAEDGDLERTGGNLTSNVTVNITVLELAAPVLDEAGPFLVLEGDSLGFTLSASDLDSDPLTLEVDENTRPDGLVLDAATGAVSWTPGFDQEGTYEVTFNVSDGTLSDSTTVTIFVLEDNADVTLDPVDDVSVFERQAVSISPVATDLDNEELTWGATGLPAGASLDAETGEIDWETTFVDAGIYTVTLMVTDGENGDSDTFTITVTDDVAVMDIRVLGQSEQIGPRDDALVLATVVTEQGGVALEGATLSLTVKAQFEGGLVTFAERDFSATTNAQGEHLFVIDPDIDGEVNYLGTHNLEATGEYVAPSGPIFSDLEDFDSYDVIV